MDVRSFIVDVGGVLKCCRVADVDDDDRSIAKKDFQ